MKIKVIAKNQLLLHIDGKTYLQSYESVVACKSDGETPILYKNWDYSRTTMKYVNKFLSDVFNKRITKKDIDKYAKNNFNTWEYDYSIVGYSVTARTVYCGDFVAKAK